MQLITARADEAIDEGCRRREVRLRVSAKDRGGKSYEVDIVNALGHEKNPLSAKELATKFARLCEPKLSKSRIDTALEEWLSIEKSANCRTAFDAVEFDGSGRETDSGKN
jgi:2-methylcitrate dehydratase PrpD